MYNLGDKTDNTSGDAGSLPAAQFNDFKNESEHLITSTGQSLTAGVGDDTYQMAKAAAIYAARGDFFTASGTANAQTLTAVSSMQTPTAFVTGMRARFIPSASCTGASTLAYPVLGTKAIRTISDSATTTGSYTSGVPCEVMYISTYNSSAGAWAIIDNGSSGGVTTPVAIADGGTGQTTAYEGLDALTVQGANIASASTTNLATATGKNVTVTGSTTITAFGTAAAGVERVVRFSAAPLITHNATSLICLGGASVQAAAGDIAGFVSLGSGNWRMTFYSVAANNPLNTGVTKGTSSATSYTADGATYTLAHGLGVMPFLYSVIAKCTSADHNFSVNDEVLLSSAGDNGSGGAADVGCNLRADSTNVYIDIGVDGIYIFDKTAFTIQKMTTTKWEFFAKAIA